MSKQSIGVIKWRKRTKEKIVLSMGGKCQICGYNKCNEALELHHINKEEKEYSFGQIRSCPISAEKIKNELKKCILLCSNCHKEIHAGTTDMPKEYQTLDESIFDAKDLEKIQEKKDRREIFIEEKIWKQKIFLTNEEVYDKLHLVFDGNKSLMAKEYGVTEAAIRKRLKILKSTQMNIDQLP